MTMEYNATLIRSWAKDRNLIEGSTPHQQMLKLTEEVGELAGAIAKQRKESAADELGDVMVVCTILAEQLGFDLNQVYRNAYEKIRHRKGRMVDGVFIKETDA